MCTSTANLEQVWYGVQSWIGGQCVFLMIAAIWPSFGHSEYMNRPLGLGANVNYMISFILFWAGQSLLLPLRLLPDFLVRCADFFVHRFATIFVVCTAGKYPEAQSEVSWLIFDSK